MTRNDRKRLARILNDPDLGPRFSRLGKRQQARILLDLRGHAARREIHAADTARRARVRQRSAERRQYARLTTGVITDRRDRVAARMIRYYGLGPGQAANLRHNLGRAADATLTRLEVATDDQMRRLVAMQQPDGGPMPFHYHTRRP